MNKFNYLVFFWIIIHYSNLYTQEVDLNQNIEEIVVTGSYIKASPTDGASPIEIINRDSIDNFGVNTVSDLVRNISSNNGSENAADSFTAGNTQGTSNINLRGIGLSSTLVLIDGRRQAVAGVTANDGSVFVNTSIIPLIAIERVEVLRDGSSAIYGADAVAGVINFVTKKNKEGFEFNFKNSEFWKFWFL